MHPISAKMLWKSRHGKHIFGAQSLNPSFFYTRIPPEMRLQKKAHAPSFQRFREKKANSSFCCQSNSSSTALAAAMLQSPTRALSRMTRIIQTEMNITMIVLPLSCHSLLNCQASMSLFPVSELVYSERRYWDFLLISSISMTRKAIFRWERNVNAERGISFSVSFSRTTYDSPSLGELW